MDSPTNFLEIGVADEHGAAHATAREEDAHVRRRVAVERFSLIRHDVLVAFTLEFLCVIQAEQDDF